MNDITRITLENSQSYVITTKVAPITVRCLFMSFQHAICNQYIWEHRVGWDGIILAPNNRQNSHQKWISLTRYTFFVIQILMAFEVVSEPSLCKWNGERILAMLMTRRDPYLFLLLSSMNSRWDPRMVNTANADPSKSCVVDSESSLQPFELIVERMNTAVLRFFPTSTPIIWMGWQRRSWRIPLFSVMVLHAIKSSNGYHMQDSQEDTNLSHCRESDG